MGQLPATPHYSLPLPEQNRESYSPTPQLPGGLRPGEQGSKGAPATLETLAARVAGLHLSWTDPEAFHLEKFTVASELRRLARELRRAA